MSQPIPYVPTFSQASGDEINIVDSVHANYFNPSCCKLNNDNFVVVFGDYINKWTICYQIYNKNGEKLSEKKTVKKIVSNNVFTPNVCALENNGFAIVYGIDCHNYSGFIVRIFNENGEEISDTNNYIRINASPNCIINTLKMISSNNGNLYVFYLDVKHPYSTIKVVSVNYQKSTIIKTEPRECLCVNEDIQVRVTDLNLIKISDSVVTLSWAQTPEYKNNTMNYRYAEINLDEPIDSIAKINDKVLIPVNTEMVHYSYEHVFDFTYDKKNDNYIIVYSDYMDAHNKIANELKNYYLEVYVRTLNRNTNVLNDRIQITKQQCNQQYPEVEVTNTNIFVFWRDSLSYEFRELDEDHKKRQLDVIGQIFNLNCEPISEQFTIQNDNSHVQEKHSSCVISDDRVLVTWGHIDPITNGGGLYGRILQSSADDNNTNGLSLPPVLPKTVNIEIFFGHLNNLVNDIKLIDETKNKIEELESRGLHVSDALGPLNEQKVVWIGKVEKLFNAMIDQMKNLKEQDDRITSNIDINSIVQEYQNEEDNMYTMLHNREQIIKNAYSSLYKNLSEDVDILSNAMETLKEYQSLGVELGNAFVKINEQTNNIVKSLKESRNNINKLIEEAGIESSLIK